MKTPLTFLFAAFVSFSGWSQIDDNFTIPATWEKDFAISLSYSGSMSGGSTELTLTFDSCIYVTADGRKAPRKRVYLMKEKDRLDILEKLRALKIDKIHSEQSMNFVNDGWSESICFGTHCIEGGTSAEMTDKDREVYSLAYRFLEEFAGNKAKR